MRFVLIHGAWLGGWYWQPIVDELRERGHEVSAPDLPCDEPGLTQHDYAAVIGPQADAVVVGHSLGALTTNLVEARRRVYLAPVVPVENAYAHSLQPRFGGTERDEEGRSYWPDMDTAATRLFPDLDRSTAEWAFPQLRRQAPLAPHVGEFRPTDTAIACLRDIAVNPQSATGVVPHIVELDAGHFPMLTHPRELADTLEEIALVAPAG